MIRIDTKENGNFHILYDNLLIEVEDPIPEKAVEKFVGLLINEYRYANNDTVRYEARKIISDLMFDGFIYAAGANEEEHL